MVCLLRDERQSVRPSRPVESFLPGHVTCTRKEGRTPRGEGGSPLPSERLLLRLVDDLVVRVGNLLLLGLLARATGRRAIGRRLRRLRRVHGLARGLERRV